VRLTDRHLNRATLHRQLLLERASLGAIDGVRHVVALQAQEAASPYIAMWNRLKRFDPADLDDAFAAAAIVKSTLIRITLHAVVAEDYPLFHAAMEPTLRDARLTDMRFRRTGLSIPEADALVAPLLAFLDRPRTKEDIQAFLVDAVGDRGPGVWWALRTYAPLLHAPTGGPWSFGVRGAFVAAPAGLRAGPVRDAAGHLVRRYLEGFGPASVADISQFTLIRRSVVRDAIESLGDDIVRLAGPGPELLDVPGGHIPDPDVPAPARLLPMWDSILVAYADRGRVIPPDYRQLVIRRNGDVLPSLLVDGLVAGVWRPVDGGIEATAFKRLAEDTWKEIDAEARKLVRFLRPRDPSVYGRYGHWWARLPTFETRILGS
jgi:hypothetical protein